MNLVTYGNNPNLVKNKISDLIFEVVTLILAYNITENLSPVHSERYLALMQVNKFLNISHLKTNKI